MGDEPKGYRYGGYLLPGDFTLVRPLPRRRSVLRMLDAVARAPRAVLDRITGRNAERPWWTHCGFSLHFGRSFFLMLGEFDYALQFGISVRIGRRPDGDSCFCWTRALWARKRG